MPFLRLLVPLAPLLAAATLLTPVAAHAASYPTAVIDSPATGDVLNQGVAIDVDLDGAPADGQADLATMVLLVDGQQVDEDSCPSPTTCPIQLDWDTTGYALGVHTLQGKVTTSHHGVGLSPVVRVTVQQVPLPTVVLTHPSAGDTVSGQVYVSATASLASDVGDTAYGMALVVDGQQAGATVPCTVPAAETCTVGLLWDTRGLAGAHTVGLILLTARQQVATVPVPVSIALPTLAVPVAPAPVVQPQPIATSMTLSSHVTVLRRSAGVVHGVLTTAAHGPAGHQPVHVAFTSITGAVRAVDVTTAADGTFVAADPDPVLATTAVTATTGPLLGSSSATLTLSVKVPVDCRTPTKALQHGKPSTVTCATPGLPNGSVVTLHYAKVGHGTVRGKVSKGTVKFSLKVAGKGWVALWATTTASPSFVGSQSRTYSVAVH